MLQNSRTKYEILLGVFIIKYQNLSGKKQCIALMGADLQTQHIFTDTAHIYRHSAYLQTQRIFTDTAHIYRHSTYLQTQHTFTDTAHIYRHSTHLQTQHTLISSCITEH
jgi:hypothetical protein